MEEEMEHMVGEADILDPVRWLSPRSDGHEQEREFLASLRYVRPSIEARRAVWNGIESAAEEGIYDHRHESVRPASGWRLVAPH
jgi:hypothetical protein